MPNLKSTYIQYAVKPVRRQAGYSELRLQAFFMKLMWKSLVQGHIDYSSHLYQPLQSSDLTRIEQLQRTFTSRIPEVRELSYWNRLKTLKMNSQQRRLERYRMRLWLVDQKVFSPKLCEVCEVK